MAKSFYDLVDDIIDLRLAEINRLRGHIGSLSDSDLIGQLSGLLIVRLYAFLESGVKDIANAYIETYRPPKITNVSEMKPCFLAWRYHPDIKRYIENISDKTKLLSIDNEITIYLNSNNDLSKISLKTIDTKNEYRTMDYFALREIYVGLELDMQRIDSHRALIKRLCDSRHDVAHGRFSVSSSANLLATADTFKQLLVEILYDVAIQCIDSYSQTLLKS